MFCCGFFLVVLGFFVLLAPSSSAKAALQVLHSPFETHLVKGQQFCGTHTPSSTSSSGDVISPWLSGICCCLWHCCHSLTQQHTWNWLALFSLSYSITPFLPRQQQLPLSTQGSALHILKGKRETDKPQTKPQLHWLKELGLPKVTIQLSHLKQGQKCVVPKWGQVCQGFPFKVRALSSETTLTSEASLPPPPEWRPTQAEFELSQKCLRGQA